MKDALTPMTCLLLRDPPSIVVIQEVYNSKNSLEKFEQELERALEDGYEVIVIEPNRLGDETSRWISVGNCLHKTAYLSGLASLGSAMIWTDKPYVCTPLCVVSLLCTGLYTLSWQFDPCVYYQVETNVKRLLPKYPELKNFHLTDSMSPVILVRGDNTRRSMLHSGVSLLAAVVCIWRLYDALK